MKTKYSDEYIRKFLSEKNIEWLDNTFSGWEHKLNLKCMIQNCRHVWSTRFGHLKHSSSRCPKCFNCIKHTQEFVRQFLLDKNIEWMDLVYTHAHILLNLKCLYCNYSWKAKFNALKNNKSGCPNCGGSLRLTYDFVKKYLLENNIELLDKEYLNSQQLLKLKCLIQNCDCEWSTNLNNIRSKGSRCPNCSKYKNEKLVNEYLKKLFSNVKIIHQYRIYSHNINISNEIYVDYYFEANNKKYIIEYNGIQHYEYNEFFHRNNINNFHKQKQRDRWLKRHCKKNNINLIVIDGRKYTNKGILTYLEENI